ncbi:MAG: CPBP family intramembrane metalloprotease [Oscillospiraceae bacterium]|nr:CPBP family intramembrane metalloprotease [Oscillospiraceae bacterium]
MKKTSISVLFDMICDGDENMMEFLSNYAIFFGIWILIIAIIAICKWNRPMLGLLFPEKKQAIRHFCIGTLLGFGTNAFCVIMSVILGDIKLTYGGFRPEIIIIFMIAVFIQSGAEEITDRMYLYSKLRRRYVSPLVAFLVNAVTFTLMHKGNDGFTPVAGMQIFAIAVLFSEFMYWYDGLWISMAFHAAWNFTQSIFFGLPNSGIVSSYSVFRLDAASAENGLFYNVGFGVEGSVGALLLISAIAVWVFIRNRGKEERNDIWRPFEAAVVQESDGESFPPASNG